MLKSTIINLETISTTVELKFDIEFDSDHTEYYFYFNILKVKYML